MTLLELAERCDKAKNDNALDVMIEVALFKPCHDYVAVRANAAGTKVIYTKGDGSEQTFWAADWTTSKMRRTAAKMLRARAALEHRRRQTMQYKSVKLASELPLKNIELVKVNGAIMAVVIAGKVRIEKGDYSGMQVLIEQPGEEADRFKLTGTIEGFPPKVEMFEYEHEAKSAAAKLEDKGAETKVEKVRVMIDEQGAVTEKAVEPEIAEDDCPF